MLKQLRIRLTLLYLLAAILLALSVGGGTYSLANYYFRTTNDQALWLKMGLQFASLGIPLPVNLYGVVKQEGLVITNPTPTPLRPYSNGDSFEGSNDDYEHREGLQESELADIYILPLTTSGELVTNAAQTKIETADQDAIKAAIRNGYDLRTIKNAEGVSIRLLTYKVPEGEEIQILQLGRYLTTQQRVLQQLLNTMIILGGLVTLLFGLASWFLAGRTIKPSQVAWDKQLTFIANASHELRAPLTLIHAGVELGLRKAESQAQKELLSDVLTDADYMKKLIEDLLLLSRLDSNALKLNFQTLDLSIFTSDILRQAERLAKANKITLIQNLKPLRISADPIRLKQVLLVILDNALRVTPSGGNVIFEVKRHESSSEICVTDTGPGIPPDQLKKIFERFYKINDKSSLEYRGSGLGLSIAKSLVEAQNGNIEIESKVGEGARVTVRFPLVT